MRSNRRLLRWGEVEREGFHPLLPAEQGCPTGLLRMQGWEVSTLAPPFGGRPYFKKDCSSLREQEVQGSLLTFGEREVKVGEALTKMLFLPLWGLVFVSLVRKRPKEGRVFYATLGPFVQTLPQKRVSVGFLNRAGIIALPYFIP